MSWTAIPICPHCKNEDYDWWDGSDLTNDGDEAVAVCCSCGKKYNVVINIDTSFHTSPVTP